MTDLSDLIARLEAATEGSRELDADIHAATAFRVPLDAGEISAVRSWALEEVICDCCQHPQTAVPHYTTSLDDAVTLVPEGFVYAAGNSGWSTNGKVTQHHWARVFKPNYQDKGSGDRYANSTPLALCSAALKARSQP